MQIQHQCNECGTVFPVIVDVNPGDSRPCPCPRCHKRFELRMDASDNAQIVDPSAKPKPASAAKKKRKRRRTFKEKVETK